MSGIDFRFQKFLYVALALFSLGASAYSGLRPTISSPSHPTLDLQQALTQLNDSSLVSKNEISLDNDSSSDRKLSRLHHYKFKDGSGIYTVMARVAKRDDFKIETYGLLTKNIKKIYIKSPRATNTVPYSMSGIINDRDSLQTCIIPGTTRLDQVNVSLFPLIDTIDILSKKEKSILAKLVGNGTHDDYSCLVLTYQPSSSLSPQQRVSTWTALVKKVQNSLSSYKSKE